MAARPRPFRFAVQSYDASSGADWREQVRTAESLGYSAFHLADHVIGPGPALNPTNHRVQTVAAIPAMAVAAEASSAIRVGCRVLCCDYHNASILAKELATIDMFSGGRVEIGLGAGWLANEYDAIGVPFRSAGERIERLAETIAVVRGHFGDGQLDVHGRHVHAVGFEGVPKAGGSERRCPPLMIGGGSRRVLGLAGREADIVSLNFDNSSGKIGPAGVGSSTAEITDAKLDWIRAGAGERFSEIEIEIGAYFTVVTDKRLATLEQMAPMFAMSADTFGEHPHALVGSVDYICEELARRRQRYGISYVTVGRAAMTSFAPVVARLAGS